MQMHLRPEGHQADKCVLRQKRDRLPHGQFDVLQFFLDDAGVDDEQEHWRQRCWRSRGSGDEVLDGGALCEELGGHVVLGDAGVVRGEVVAREAERADPDLGGEVDTGEGVEERRARRLAAEWRVGKGRRREGLGGADRGDGGGERNDAAAGFNLGPRPGVPCEADRVRAIGVGGRRSRGGVGRHD